MEERFSCLAWGANFNPELQSGLIAGGMQDGSLLMWDSSSLMDPYQDSLESLVANISLYEENQFSCLEWSPFKKEKLATGGSNLYIVDCEKDIENPEVYCPNSKKDQDPITSVSWNKNKTVPHILATASTTGIVNVWDLKVKKSISSFRDKSQEANRDVRISWNPNIPTQMAVVFDDAREAGIQIWDLRNSKAPVTVFKDNHKNVRVHSLGWSISDPNLVLTADRNNLISCQNIKTNETLILEQETREIVSVQFADALESVFITGDIDGTLAFHTLDQSMLKKLSTTHAPKWMKNPASVATDMNGAVAFRESTGDLSSVRLEQTKTTETGDSLKTLSDLVDENSVESIAKHYSRENKDLWNLVLASNMSDEDMLQSLGFNSEEIVTKTENLTGKSHKKKTNENRRNSSSKMNFEFTDMNPDQAEDFFNQLSKVEDEQEETVNTGAYYSIDLDEKETRFTRNENWDAGLEDLIRRNIVIGNFHGAIDCAIKAGRYSHAFLIAYSKKDHPELLQAAAEGIALINNDRMSFLLQNMIEDKLDDIIASHDLKRWKELAALIISNYPQQKETLLHSLSLRLQKEHFINQALAVCLISHDYNSLFEIITTEISSRKGQDLEATLIKNFIVLYAIAQVTGQVSHSKSIQHSLCQLVHIMIEHEEFKLAMRFLEELGDSSSEEIAFLKNCIYYANESTLKMFFSPPHYAFVIKVKQPAKPAPAKAAPVQTKAGQRQTAGPQQSSENKRKPIARPTGSTWTEKGQDDDSASLTSEVDPNKHFAGGRHAPPSNQALNMHKRPGPSLVKPGPPPAPAPVTKGPAPSARPGPPPPKTNFSNKSTEEVIEHHLASSKVSEKTVPQPPHRPGPPVPKTFDTQSQSGGDHHAPPSKAGPPPAPPGGPRGAPAPPGRPGPPPPAIQPPKVAPPAPQAPPAPVVTAPPSNPPAPKAGPPRPAGPPPVAKIPGPPAPTPAVPKDIIQSPPKAAPVPPGPPKVAAPQPPKVQESGPTPARPGPPPAPARPGPPAPVPTPGAPQPGRPGPPARPGPPGPAPPVQANKGPAPPGAPPRGPALPKGQPARQQEPEQEDEEETEQESVISGLDQCLDFIRDIVT